MAAEAKKELQQLLQEISNVSLVERYKAVEQKIIDEIEEAKAELERRKQRELEGLAKEKAQDEETLEFQKQLIQEKINKIDQALENPSAALASSSTTTFEFPSSSSHDTSNALEAVGSVIKETAQMLMMAKDRYPVFDTEEMEFDGRLQDLVAAVTTKMDLKENLTAIAAARKLMKLNEGNATTQTVCWGSNRYNRLGFFDADFECQEDSLLANIHSKPSEFLDGTDVQQISTGLHFTVALTKTGSVISWGENSSGELGTGDIHNVTNSFVIVPFFKNNNIKIVQIATGAEHTIAVSNKNDVYTWGNNRWGNLGTGTKLLSSTPKLLHPFPAKVVRVLAGRTFSLILLENNAVYAMGDNSYGQLGLGNTTRISSIPTLVPGLNGQVIKQVACANCALHVLNLKAEGRILSMGSNTHGQCGINDSNTTKVYQLTEIRSLYNIIKVATGQYFSIALDKMGQIWGFGLNDYGQLGINSRSQDIVIPSIIDSIGNKVAMQLSCGSAHTLILTNDNKVIAAGWGEFGQLGSMNTISTHKFNECAVINKFHKGRYIHKVMASMGQSFAVLGTHLPLPFSSQTRSAFLDVTIDFTN